MKNIENIKNINHNNQNTIQNSRLAFIGLGVMGAPMALHLAQKMAAIHGAIYIYNRSVEKTEKLAPQSSNFEMLTDLADVARHADIIFTCIGDDDSVRQTINQLLKTAQESKKSLIIVDHTTTSAKLAQEMYALCKQQGSQFLDCPVSGGEAGAKNGTLTAMVGGDEAVFKKIQPIIAAYSRAQNYFGEAGAGQTAKMVNQILIANILQGLSEAFNLAQKANLDLELLVDTLSLGAAGSWQLANRGKTIAADQFNFGFAIDLMIKDLGIVEEFALEKQIPIPQTQSIRKIYQKLSDKGLGRFDTSALIKQFELGLN